MSAGAGVAVSSVVTIFSLDFTFKNTWVAHSSCHKHVTHCWQRHPPLRMKKQS